MSMIRTTGERRLAASINPGGHVAEWKIRSRERGRANIC